MRNACPGPLEGSAVVEQRNFFGTQFHPELDCQALLQRIRTYPEYIKRIAGVSYDQFVSSCRDLVRMDEAWVPSVKGQSLYLQPKMIATESGLGMTWQGNSPMNKLTPWSNDPVSDPPGEVVYLRDTESGEVWLPTPGISRDDVPYTVRHAPGKTTFEHERVGIASRLTLGIAVMSVSIGVTIGALLGAIAGFEMEVRAWRPTFKLSQNKSVDDRANVAEALELAEGPDHR